MVTHQTIPQYQVQAFGSGTVAAATATATAPAVAGKTFFMTGITLTGSGPTTASAIDLTVTGILNGTLHYTITPLAGVLLAAFPNGMLNFVFQDPIPASAQNQAVAVVMPSLGGGSTNATATLYGFYQ
jgi:hypothetical protein